RLHTDPASEALTDPCAESDPHAEAVAHAECGERPAPESPDAVSSRGIALPSAPYPVWGRASHSRAVEGGRHWPALNRTSSPSSANTTGQKWNGRSTSGTSTTSRITPRRSSSGSREAACPATAPGHQGKRRSSGSGSRTACQPDGPDSG